MPIGPTANEMLWGSCLQDHVSTRRLTGKVLFLDWINFGVPYALIYYVAILMLSIQLVLGLPYLLVPSVDPLVIIEV